MEPKSLVLIIALVLLVGAADADDQIQTLDDGCPSYCGDVQIPYPFGVGISNRTGMNCSLEKAFNVSCTDSTLYKGNITIIAINVNKGQVDMKVFVSKVCYNSSFGSSQRNGNKAWLTTDPAFTISSDDNRFTSVGCDTYGYLNSFYGGRGYSTGCLTRCYGNSVNVSDGECSGIGCCQVDIPLGMRNITVQTFSFQNFYDSLDFNNCSYSFVAKKGEYNFSRSHLRYLPNSTVPVVFDWTVGNGETCEDSKRRGTNACKGINTICMDWDTGFGYRCLCEEGYEGNPYHPNGCTDIDECKDETHDCMTQENCRNRPGIPSYECWCPKGQSGKGTKEQPCQKESALSKYAVGASAGFIALIVAISLLFLMYQKRKHFKMKEKFFEQNGGFILRQQLSALSVREGEESSQTAKIFTAEELKKATNNYDENLIVGKGGYGTVFKGILANNRIVAVKKSKTVDESQKEQFINEVVVLSQVNHRNVVKLLGCCLEQEVPILVYEFVNNGTLFDLVHNGGKENNLTWKTRLRIAVEAAEALSYLHAAASIPIVHRDVKSANILLDDTYTAKVSDFGASRLVPLDQIALGTKVQGTFGYLDPEYMQTGQLTEKSDVYSFGVVLLELLTGEKPFDASRPEEKRSTANYLLSCLENDRLFEALQVGIMNEENKEEIKEVAILASKCLRLKGEERPSMKEVGMELEGIRLMQKHFWTNGDKNLEETQYLLPKSSFEICGDGESSSYQNIVNDSIRDQVLIAFDDGR